MNNRCLYCYEPVDKETDFHERCSMKFFSTKTAPALEYSLGEMAALAKNVVESSIAVPGLQPKLSLTMVSEVNVGKKLTVVGARSGLLFRLMRLDYRYIVSREKLTHRL